MRFAIQSSVAVATAIGLSLAGCGFSESVPRISNPIALVSAVKAESEPPFAIRIQTHDPALLSEVATPGKVTVNFLNRSSESAVFSTHPYFLRFSFIGESHEFISRATRIVPDHGLRKLPPEMIVVVPAGGVVARDIPIPLQAPTDYIKVRILARLEPVSKNHLNAAAQAMVESRIGFYPSWKGGIWSNKIPAIPAPAVD